MVLRKILSDVTNRSEIFGIIVNGTKDILGKEQESICVRYINDMFNIKEFLGLYNVESTSGQAICAMILNLNQITTEYKKLTIPDLRWSSKYVGKVSRVPS